MKLKKFHYSWIIVFVSGLLMFGMSAQQMSQGVFLPRVAESLGVGMGTVSLAYSTSSYCMLIMTPLAATLYRKFPTKILGVIAVLDQTMSLIILSFAQNIWVIALGCLLECFSISSILNVMPSVLIKRWFKDKGQFAYNVILFISMLGGVCFTSVASKIISAYDWRTAYRCLAAFILAIEFPITLMLLKDDPSRVGQTAYEDPNAVKNNTIKNRPVMNADVTRKTAWKNLAFYLVCLYSITFTYSATLQNHLVKHLTSTGFTAELGATVLTAGMIGGLVGRVILSIAGEKFSLKTMNLVYCGIGILSAFMLCNSAGKSTAFVIAMGFLFGAAVKVSTVQLTLMRYKVFGASEDYTQIIANMAIVTNLITATSGTVYGYIYDWTGSYTGSFILSISAFAASIILAFVILRGESRKKEALETA